MKLQSESERNIGKVRGKTEETEREKYRESEGEYKR